MGDIDVLDRQHRRSVSEEAPSAVAEERARRDRELAFHGLADRHLERSYRLATVVLDSATESQDVVHDAFVTAWRKYDTLRDPDRLEAWFETRLRSAYRSRAERTDPGALTERVHSIPATVEPERRRWWHRFRSGATRRGGLGGAQVRGASNMLSATRVAVVVASLALGTTYLAVQVGDPPEAAPQPASPATDNWAIVTGTQTLAGASPDCAMAAQNRDMSDPRLEGDVCIDYEGDEGGENLATYWSSITITNDDGSWQGHSVGFMDEQEAHRHTGWFEGHGAYEGLAFIQQLTEANPEFPSAGVNLDMVGLIYEGQLPPMIIPDWAADTAGDAE